MALLDEVRSYLIAQSVGVAGSTADWVVSRGFAPPSPNRVLVIFETGGLQDELHEANPVTRPSFQLYARGNSVGDYATARAKLESAQTAFIAVGPATTSLGGRKYVCIVPQSQPISLGLDENELPRVVQNYVALRSRTT